MEGDYWSDRELALLVEGKEISNFPTEHSRMEQASGQFRMCKQMENEPLPYLCDLNASVQVEDFIDWADVFQDYAGQHFKSPVEEARGILMATRHYGKRVNSQLTLVERKNPITVFRKLLRMIMPPGAADSVIDDFNARTQKKGTDATLFEARMRVLYKHMGQV